MGRRHEIKHQVLCDTVLGTKKAYLGEEREKKKGKSTHTTTQTTNKPSTCGGWGARTVSKKKV